MKREISGFQEIDYLELCQLEGGSYTNTAGVTYSSAAEAQWVNSPVGQAVTWVLDLAASNLSGASVWIQVDSNGVTIGGSLGY